VSSRLPNISCVGLFCLSNYPDETRYREGLAHLHALGVQTVEPPQPIPRMRPFAGTDAYRADAFNALVADPRPQLLMAVRGGSGAARALPLIDFAALKASGKWLCGYSDTTALLLAAAAKGCTRLIHGPMLCSSLAQEMASEGFRQEINSLTAVLAGERNLLPLRARARTLIIRGATGIIRGATGRLFPANMTLLESLIGTPYLPNLSGALLVLEDVNVPAHAIDRTLNHLRQAGILENLAGLAFGHFTEVEDAEWLPEILAEYAAHIHGPVLTDFPLGHQHPSIALPCNRMATLTAAADTATLTLAE